MKEGFDMLGKPNAKAKTVKSVHSVKLDGFFICYDVLHPYDQVYISR